jgi:hypothetical protein
MLAPPGPAAQTNSRLRSCGARSLDLGELRAAISAPSVLILLCLGLNSRLNLAHFKIKMPMLPAPGIKSRPATWTPRLALQIFPNRHLHAASPAQNRPRIPLPPRPDCNRMPRQRNMAILASIVDPAAPHLDRNNIHGRPVMCAPRLRIKLNSVNLWTLLGENGVLPSVSRGGPGLQPWLGGGARATAPPAARSTASHAARGG